MSIDRFYTTTVTIQRMQWSGEQSSLTSAGSVTGHVQQARPEFAESIGEAWGKTFLLWCDEAEDVRTGDTLTIASGDYAGTYSVKNVTTNATGRNQHLECVIVKDPDEVE
jgi:hypothetical protein